MEISHRTYVVILAGTAVWCGAIILAPFLASSSSPLSGVVYQFFHPICHQLPERSFYLFGEKLAVCSRCSSVYFSFLLVAALYPFVRSLTTPAIPHRHWLLLAMLPMLIDVGLGFFNLHNSTFVTRALTGAILGATAPLYILPAAIEAVQQLSTKRLSSSTT